MSTTLEYLIRLRDQLSPNIMAAAKTADNAGSRIKRVVDGVHSGSRVMSSSLNDLRNRLKAVNDVRFGTVLVNEFRQATREAKSLERQIERLEGTNKRAANGFRIPVWAKGALATGAIIAEAKSDVMAAVQRQRVSNALNFTTGGMGKDAMRAISQTSNEIGLDKMAGFEGFKTVSASVRSLNFSLDQQLEIYRGMSEAAATFNLQSHDTKLAYLALGQMASKGVVSSEELRKQLGEKIPGALGIAARAMGVSERKLNDMLKKGEIMAKDFLPRFARQLHKEFGQSAIDASSGAQAALNRFNNAIADTKVWVGDKLLPVMTSLWNRTAEFLNASKSAPTILRQEQGAISSLLHLITGLNEGNNTRKLLLQQLVKEYPKLFGNIDIEKVKNHELLLKLNEVNAAYEKRVALANNDLIISKSTKSFNTAQGEFLRYLQLAELAKRKDPAGMAAYESLYNFGEDNQAANWARQQSRSKGKTFTKSDFFTHMAEVSRKEMETAQGILNREKSLKSSNEFSATVDEAYKLANNKDALSQRFGKNSKGQKEFLALAKQISLAAGPNGALRYKTNGGGMAWAEKLRAAMNPAAAGSAISSSEFDGTDRASNINNGGQRSIIININKQVEKLEVHSVNVKEGIEEVANLVRQEMRRVVQSVNGLENN